MERASGQLRSLRPLTTPVLPELIEIVPLKQPVSAEITVPGSKSITNRALMLAALANGETKLAGALWSEDTQVMVDCLRKLGFEVEVEPDANEFCNRAITVKGLGGKIPNAGTVEKPLELFVGNAGTAARFLSALVCLGNGVYRLSGVPRMHERPQAALFGALRELGYRIESANDKLPVIVHGEGWKPGTCHVRVNESSQFASALLMGAKIGGWDVRVSGDDLEEMPYVRMTERLIEVFPKTGGEFAIEPDASSGSYFWAAGWLLLVKAGFSFPPGPINLDKFFVRVANWPSSGWQIDAEFPNFIPPPDRVSRAFQLGDSIMTDIILAADHHLVGIRREPKPPEFSELGRLRMQETERVVALRTELTRCGARVLEEGDTLKVYPCELHGAEIETYNDHRMAMCFAILGLKVPGIRIKNPACVKKTFPNFFQKLAAPPPHGLGVTILDCADGRALEEEELFAE
jgi:3-phosphoshikimate 1-carboxyvinyltransferase